MRIYLFALLVAGLGPNSFAAPRSCPAALTGSASYLKILGQNLTPKAEKAEITNLLDAAFSPVLQEIARGLNELSPAAVNFWAQKYADTQAIKPITQALNEEGLDAGYDGFFAGAFVGQAMPFQAASLLRAPFTRFNKSVMSRLEIIMRVVDAYIARSEGHLRELPSFAASGELLKDRTFGGAQLAFSMKYGNESILYAVALLTASPLGDLKPEALFRAVIEPQGTRPSLVTLLALALPPNLLGVYGGQNFIHDPLVLNENGQPILSPKLKAFLKRYRLDDPAAAQKFELGLGCPVARGALPAYIAAIARLYFEWPRHQ